MLFASIVLLISNYCLKTICLFQKKNFDSENAQENVTVPPLKGTKRHSSPSGCPPPNPKRKALGDVTNVSDSIIKHNGDIGRITLKERT